MNFVDLNQHYKCMNKYVKIKSKVYLFKKIIMEQSLTFFQTIRKFLKGQLDFDALYESSDLIESIHKKHPRNETELVIEFKSSDDLLELIGLSDDDIHFEGMINSTYSDSEFYSWDSSDEDFKEGYIPYHAYDETNLERLKGMCKYLVEGEFDIHNNEYAKKLNSVLMSLFEKQTQNIIDDYTSYRNSEMRESAQKHVEEELEEFFKPLNFEIWNKWDSIVISVGELYTWYATLGSLNSDLPEILEKIFKTQRKRNSIGGWWDMMYEFGGDEYFDSISFNRDVDRYLDRIEEQMEESYEEFGGDFQEYMKMVQRITNKFTLGTWYKIPKSNGTFKILGFDIETGYISVYFNYIDRDNNVKSVKHLFSEENFNNLLYQPSLFDFDELY